MFQFQNVVILFCITLHTLLVFGGTSATRSIRETSQQVSSPCALKNCPNNSTCIKVPTNKDCREPTCPHQAKCIPNIPIAKSKMTSSHRPGRVSCANKKCPEKQYCVLNQVKCFRAPCPPIPTCRPYPKPGITCSSIRCAGGQCTMQKKCEKPNFCSLRPVCIPGAV